MSEEKLRRALIRLEQQRRKNKRLRGALRRIVLLEPDFDEYPQRIRAMAMNTLTPATRRKSTRDDRQVDLEQWLSKTGNDQ
jgi:hypothetical protein